MTNKMNEGFEWLSTDESLKSAVDLWLKEPFIAIDTEFERTATYYAKAGLIQIADSQGVYLIDPLIITDLSLLAPVLASRDVVKVLHSMSEDVELLRHVSGVAPDHVFDTQIAASFLGYGASLGYQNLVETTLGYVLDKSETRSDWLRRPLSDKQLDYAAKDAEHLVELYHYLNNELVDKDLLGACLEEAQTVVDQNVEAWQNPELAYLKLRGGWELSRERQQRLKQMVVWRDTLARTEDVPKSWVFADAVLIAVAEAGTIDAAGLKRLKGIRYSSVRQYGPALMTLLEEGSDIEEHDFVLIDGPIKGKEMLVFKTCKKLVAQVAEETGISVQLLGSRKMLERVILQVMRKGDVELPRDFQGWRAALLGQKLMNLIHV